MPGNKVTFWQILLVPFDGNTHIYRDVYRRRSNNTSSTCYRWLKLIVYLVVASTAKLLAADLLSIFTGVFQGAITWILLAIQISWLLFSERFPGPDSSTFQVKSKKCGTTPDVKSKFFFSSRGTETFKFSFFTEARILPSSLHEIMCIVRKLLVLDFKYLVI